MQIQCETLVQLRKKINRPFSQSNISSLTNVVQEDAVIQALNAITHIL